MSILKRRRGFTLLEILIVMALIAILIGIVVVALNPARQFASARNSTRYAHLNTVMSAISSNMAENRGTFTCASGAIPATSTLMASTGGYNIAPCLVTNFISSMPVDPSDPAAIWTSTSTYASGYAISRGADGRITLDAPSAELGSSISLTR
ncbi:type II secretion system protein [Patescibacteria group bacterium]|nr:MAG: type II secretion system protein [Patescibacteria group bacterium]